ncbi:3-hydroxyacyl-CoA dehydrogenase NAD-binding domain-containing protein [Nesterenkonia muleiensis]|uniref:3-hydroxyacyl-CoA dehydrogenase NAD-binding domain-containing protein n=1 Tax=Nesterenkonia muleiensis TaxID=2282648 RepID=UPI003B75C674
MFCRAGRPVRVYEPDQTHRQSIRRELHARLDQLDTAGLLDRDTGIEPTTAAAQVQITGDLAEAVEETYLVQECIPELVDAKQGLFKRLSPLISSHTVVVSLSSAISASRSGECLINGVSGLAHF